MPTRLRKPSPLKQLALTAVLAAIQIYLGFSALGGQFGIESNKQMLGEIKVLKAREAQLQAQSDALSHRKSLFNPQALDPDILTERARAMLSMVHPEDIIVVDKPVQKTHISVNPVDQLDFD